MEDHQIMMPGKLKEYQKKKFFFMIVLEKIKSTGRQVISVVVVMVRLAFTKWISHVNQFRIILFYVEKV